MKNIFKSNEVIFNWFSYISLIKSATKLNHSLVSQSTCKNVKYRGDCQTNYCTLDLESSSYSNKPFTQFNKDDCDGVLDNFYCVWNYETIAYDNFTQYSDSSFKIRVQYNVMESVNINSMLTQQIKKQECSIVQIKHQKQL
ncbi:unnamed protein product [Paramecium sonneborni]|uniref:Uncharacterized protein n=1 Tax=Paramecium sonneborni TaxID=65129 RepID=A0A8S1PKM3_9CILI|nr:unnamed protein product [Paramecium sonneborni]